MQGQWVLLVFPINYHQVQYGILGPSVEYIVGKNLERLE